MIAEASKHDRQREILELIRSEEIDTQAELVRRLSERGLRVAQSTVSRDMRDLGLSKVPKPDGGYRYEAPDNVVPLARHTFSLLREFIVEIDGSGSIAAVKTDPGNAHPVGVALDRLAIDIVVGTVAGDDTLFVLLREGVHWTAFQDRMQEMLR